jgi:hypothetical protein
MEINLDSTINLDSLSVMSLFSSSSSIITFDSMISLSTIIVDSYLSKNIIYPIENVVYLLFNITTEVNINN